MTIPRMPPRGITESNAQVDRDCSDLRAAEIGAHRSRESVIQSKTGAIMSRARIILDFLVDLKPNRYRSGAPDSG
jgi:hypothetical protein